MKIIPDIPIKGNNEQISYKEIRMVFPRGTSSKHEKESNFWSSL